MTATAIIAHRIPGRLRLVVTEKRGDAPYFSQIHDAFSAIDAVQRVQVNPKTASIVLEFTGAWQRLIARGKAMALFDIAPLQAPRLPDVSRLEKKRAPINLVSGREIDPWFMLGVAFLVLGFFQTLRGQVLVPAMTAFWYARRAFFHAAPSDIDQD